MIRPLLSSSASKCLRPPWLNSCTRPRASRAVFGCDYWPPVAVRPSCFPALAQPNSAHTLHLGIGPFHSFTVLARSWTSTVSRRLDLHFNAAQERMVTRGCLSLFICCSSHNFHMVESPQYKSSSLPTLLQLFEYEVEGVDRWGKKLFRDSDATALLLLHTGNC